MITLRRFQILIALIERHPRSADDDFGLPISYQTVHTILVRLEEAGLVGSTRSKTLPKRGGKAKRMFRITAKGRKAVKEFRNEVQTNS